MTPSRIALIFLVALAAVYVAVVLAGPRHAFWTIDGGLKFVTVERLAGSSFRDVSIPYPGERIDPAGDFFPMKPPMATRVGERFYPDVSLVFPILAAPLYMAFSWMGLYLLPLAATLVALWLVYRLGRPVLGTWSPWAIPILGLATPLFFYAVTFWEHNLAVLATTAAVVVLLRDGNAISIRTSLAAGLLLGAAIWFREECYLFAASVVLTLLVTRSGLRSVAGSIAGAAATVFPLWILQWQVLGKPFGKRVEGAAEYGLLPQETGTGVLGYLGDRVETLYAWTLGLHQNAGLTLLVSIPLIAGLVLFLILGRNKNRLVLTWGATAVYAILCLAVLGSLDERVFSTYFAGGLFATAPILAVLLTGAILPGEHHRARREIFLGVLVLIFLSAAVLLSPVKYQRGVHWGPRYLLPVLPFAAILGLAGIRRAAGYLKHHRAVAALGVLVLVLSFAIQTHSITALQIKKRGTARTLDFLREDVSGEIITNVWWFPLEVAATYSEHRIFGVTDTPHFHQLIDRFRTLGIDRFTIVAGPMDDRILKDPVIRVEHIRPVLYPGMGYFDLLFCDCSLATGE